jgi:hypothetical protein
MKSYGFNLLPQKSKAIIRKEEKRDNFSVSTAVLPLTSVFIWLVLVLVNNLYIEASKRTWENSINLKKQLITGELAPILIKNGEMVAKTNILAEVIKKDIQPEQLFVLIDQIYQKQDPTFKILGYARNSTGSFSVEFSAISYNRLAEIARRFGTYNYIENVSLEQTSLDTTTNMVVGNISFDFNYQTINQQTNAGTSK